MSDTLGKLFIGGLSWDTTDEQFLTFFQEFGNVIDHIVMRNPDGQSRGFGFVTFENPEDCHKVTSQQLRLDGRRIDCKPAVPKNSGGGSGGYSGGYSDSSHNSGGGVRNRGGRGGGSRGCKIFVGGLSRDTHKEEFEGYFNKYGHVVDAIVMLDRETQRSRGFGFVTFDNEQSVDDVLSQSVHIITDKQVECKRAIPKEQLPSPPDLGGGGGYGGGGGGGGGYGRETYQQPVTVPYPTTAYGAAAAPVYQPVYEQPVTNVYGQNPGYVQTSAPISQPSPGQYFSAFTTPAPSYVPQPYADSGLVSSQQSDQANYGAVRSNRTDNRPYHPYGRR